MTLKEDLNRYIFERIRIAFSLDILIILNIISQKILIYKNQIRHIKWLFQTNEKKSIIIIY